VGSGATSAAGASTVVSATGAAVPASAATAAVVGVFSVVFWTSTESNEDKR
jgi:hypothetical protein